MKMLIHNLCDGQVGIKLKYTSIIATDIGLSNEYAIINICDISTENYEEIPPHNYFCKRCRQNIEEKDIMVMCGDCGKTLPLEEIFRIKDRGGLYCRKDLDKIIERYPDEKIVFLSVLEILNKGLVFQ